MTTQRVISADSHIQEPPELFSEWLPEKFRDKAPRIVERAGWYSTRNFSWITSATSHELHSSVSYPRASGPRLRMRSSFLRSPASSSGLRPARPAFLRADLPDSDIVFAQRYTDCRWTSSRRAVSAWLKPRFNKRAASRRRSSRASNSRRTPAGFPMPGTVAGTHRYVNYIM